jgi:uncharacterized membrane protein
MPPTALLAIEVAVSSITALALSWRLWRRGRAGDSLPGCGSQSGCNTILSSRWAWWGRIPIAGLGVLLYGSLTCAAMASSPIFTDSIRHFAWPMVVILALIAGGGAVWFSAIQLLVIRRVCAYCMGIHVLSVLIFIVMIRDYDWHEIVNHHGGILRFGELVAGCALIVLIAGQFLLRPKGYTVRVAEEVASKKVEPVEAELPAPIDRPAPDSTASRPPGLGRDISLVGGRLRLCSNEYPLLGSPDAELIIAYLFDYTCPSCRRIHRILAEAVERLAPMLAVMMLPVPQEPECNPYIQQASPASKGRACRYARLTLRIWADHPARFTIFERWILDGEELPSFDAALLEAIKLLGGEELNADRHHAVVDRLLAKGAAAHQAARTQKIPTILLPRATITGEVPSIDKLLEIFQKELAMKDRLPAKTVK